MKTKQIIAVALTLLFACAQKTYAFSAQLEQQQEMRAVDIVSYGVYDAEREDELVKGYIEFQNNTADSIQLIHFSFDGYGKAGEKIMTSVDNTNDLNQPIPSKDSIAVKLRLPTNLAALHVKIDKYETADGSEYILEDTGPVKLDFTPLIKETAAVESSSISVGSPNGIEITEHSSFLIEGTTPAVKVTLLNNTEAAVSKVEVKVITNGGAGEIDYEADLLIGSGKEAAHSGWGLHDGAKNIDIAICSYTTADGEKFIIPRDEMQWKYIDL